MKQILNFDAKELETELVENLQVEPFRARQIFPWIYRRGVTDFSDMSDMSQLARTKLAENYTIYRPKVDTIQESVDGTRKYLFELEDGQKIETVLIRQTNRWTLCVSSQVGCAIGCKFCRTALMGLKRHLQTHEILGQVLAVRDDIATREGRPRLQQCDNDFSNIVFMGMGEPLHNFENVTRALRILTAQLGLGMTPRKITVSTSGLAPAIIKLADEAVPSSLALSLNHSFDEGRTQVMPINKRYPLKVLMDACKHYNQVTNKHVTMEYVMLGGVNDTDADLLRLPKLLAGLDCKINLIPYNMNAGLGYNAPTDETIQTWQRTLNKKGINTRVRWSKGPDISAACGQLAVKKDIF